MVETPVRGYVTVLTANWLIPIGKLWDSLTSTTPVPPSDVQTSAQENGLSIGLVAMTVLLLESALHRTHYVMKSRNDLIDPETDFNSTKFFRTHFDEDLLDTLEELITIRNIVAHNHLWECDILDDLRGLEVVGLYEHMSGGDKKFTRIVDKTTLKTRKLGINIIPTKIWREDARRVLVGSYKILEYLENKDRSYAYLSVQPIRLRNSAIEFHEFIAGLETTEYTANI